MSGEVVKLAVSQKQVQRNCVDCRFHRAHKNGRHAYCVEVQSYCSTERSKQFDSISRCGSEGRLWEKRPPKPKGFWEKFGDVIIERIGNQSA